MAAELTHPSTPPAARQGRLRAPVRRSAIWGPLLIVLALALMLVGGIWRHLSQKHARQDYTQKVAQTTVDVVNAKRDAKPRDVLLPGNISAMQETTIYARANGYVARWLVDIGDVVKENQLLAELETPELDQQLAGARENLKQAETNVELARTTAARWQELVQHQVVSRQENDEKQANYKSSKEGLDASKANLARLEQLQGFKKIVAPFAGKITSRKVDVGSLVSQGSGNAGTVLFTIAQTDPLRVFVNVPQADAPLIEVGGTAKILVQELASRDFTGKVTRTSGALDPTSRTLQTEVQIPNHDGVLLAGMYTEVKFTVHDKGSPLIVPANVFIFRESGPQVAIVTQDNKIHWQKIEVGRDFGTTMEVLKGLDEQARVVLNPTDDLTENLAVQPKAKDEKKEGGEGPKPADKERAGNDKGGH